MEARAGKEGANEKSAEENREVQKEGVGGWGERELLKDLNGLRNQGCFKGLRKAV